LHDQREDEVIAQMRCRPVALSVAALCLATANAVHGETPEGQDSKFFLWTDTSVTLLPYGSGFEVDPGEQSTLTLEHAHASSIGDLFMFVDFTHFHDQDAETGNDSTWYGEIGPRLSLGKVFGATLSRTLFRRSLFEIKDVLLAAQYERGEDADVAEAVLLGLGFDLDVSEAGILGGTKFNYLQVNFYGRDELTAGVQHGFRDMQITTVGSYPFKAGRASCLIDGYFDWVLGIGSEDWSFHFNPQITVDVGEFWNAPKKLYAGVEVDLWLNKYQIPDSSAFDTNQTAISLMAKYHF
jgi:nucleoside-specific outer membrane channel protein Tsx